MLSSSRSATTTAYWSDDPTLAADLFRHAWPFLPGAIDGRALVGFDERWRLYRYGPGQAFKPHRDGAYTRLDVWEESRLTFIPQEAVNEFRSMRVGF